MCGLAGSVQIAGTATTVDLEAALTSLHHRGPDARGSAEVRVGEFTVALRHSRLSIIDLSRAADQPMQSSDGRLVLVFNGEIYNYRELRAELSSQGCDFSTSSDTEVLLNAWAVWGEACLVRLKGMFAFALVDRREGRLVMARDAFGIKPLYLLREPGGLVFASELPALLGAAGRPLPVDSDAVTQYLLYGDYDTGEQTFVEGVKAVPAGHLVEISLRNGELDTRTKRWWWPSVEPELSLPFSEAAEKVRHLFLESIRLHLRSDVPIGFALSGGVDSSAVVCAARAVEPDLDIHTFTYAAADDSLNEEAHAQIVNEYVGAKSHFIRTDAHALYDDLERLLLAQGEPFGSTSIFAQYSVFGSAAAAGVTVMLDGQGADELFAGYHGFPASRVRSLLERGQWFDAVRFVRASGAWPGRSARSILAGTVMSYLPPRARHIARRARRPPYDWLRGRNSLERRADADDHDGPPGRQLAAELRRQLTGNGQLSALLRHADRNSMHFSVESRVPFLDVELAEFLLRLPESYLVSPEGETKHVFRAAMRGIVPDAILDRRDKIGFETPDSAWVRQMLVRDLSGGMFDGFHFLNQGLVERDLTAWLRDPAKSDTRWWRLVNLVLWLKRMEELGLVSA